jgi:hypothetical protein
MSSFIIEESRSRVVSMPASWSVGPGLDSRRGLYSVIPADSRLLLGDCLKADYYLYFSTSFENHHSRSSVPYFMTYTAEKAALNKLYILRRKTVEEQNKLNGLCHYLSLKSRVCLQRK